MIRESQWIEVCLRVCSHRKLFSFGAFRFPIQDANHTRHRRTHNRRQRSAWLHEITLYDARSRQRKQERVKWEMKKKMDCIKVPKESPVFLCATRRIYSKSSRFGYTCSCTSSKCFMSSCAWMMLGRPLTICNLKLNIICATSSDHERKYFTQ